MRKETDQQEHNECYGMHIPKMMILFCIPFRVFQRLTVFLGLSGTLLFMAELIQVMRLLFTFSTLRVVRDVRVSYDSKDSWL